MESYDPTDKDWSPSAWLGAYAQALHDEFSEFWELDGPRENSEITEEHRSHLRHLKAIADALSPCLHSLSASNALVGNASAWFDEIGVERKVDEKLAVSIAHALHKNHAIVRDTIKLDLASTAAEVLLSGAETRAVFLLALIADRPLPNRAAAFLDRATKLYLWGFGPECVVLCACVLEAAYEEQFPLEEMFRLQIRRRRNKSGEFDQYRAVDYERAALAAGIFTRAEQDLAGKVRVARNDTLHFAPNIALSAEDALTATAHLLSRLLSTT
jgi:hypothetical protein